MGAGGNGRARIPIVDVKPDVRRHQPRLHGGEVRPDDVAVGKLIAHLDGPEASPGRDVEDLARRVLVRQRREVFAAIQQDVDDLVLIVLAF